MMRIAAYTVYLVFVLALLDAIISLFPKEHKVQKLRPFLGLIHMIKGRFFTFIFLALLSFPSFSTTYYVATPASGGSDSNPGTEAQPWATPRKCADTVVSGDICLIRAGTYDVTNTDCIGGQGGYGQVPTRVSNTTYKNYPGERPILTATMSSEPCPVIGWDADPADNMQNIVIEGLEIDGQNANGVGIRFEDCNGCVVRNNIVHNITHPSHTTDNCPGVSINTTTNALIEENVIHDICLNTGGSSENHTGVLIYLSTGAIIQHNEIYNTRVGVWNKDNGSNNTIRFNYIHNIASHHCIFVGTTNGHPATSNKAYQNVCYGPPLHGIRLDGSSGGAINTNPQVYNNTIVNAGGDCIAVGQDGENLQREIYNNICYNSSASALDGGTDFTTCSHMQVFGASLPGVNCQGNLLTSNPNFVSTAFNDVTNVKRTSYPADGLGGVARGAYLDDNTCIGLTANCGPQPEPPELDIRSSWDYHWNPKRGTITFSVMVVLALGYFSRFWRVIR